ncbi:MAG: hypothetical protein JWO82_508 [Akkermansiaceae bacterium]|nr:hypothetical protein [Akkermansiaceae bacterium]
MTSTRLRRNAGWLLVGLSLALHLFTVFAYSRQPDRLAAFTVMPVWVWGGCGLALSIAAFWFLRASLSLVVTGVWALTVLLAADEARALTRLGSAPPKMGAPPLVNGSRPLRIVTLNCSYFDYDKGFNPIDDIAKWDPDIVLLQEVHTYQVKKICEQLYGPSGDSRCHQNSNGVATRWKITREVRNLLYRDQQLTVQTPDGIDIEILNIHLATAATDLRFWRSSCWATHLQNRLGRRTEMAAALGLLRSEGGGRPSIVGGDFNAPPGDPIQRMVLRDHQDAFAAVGSGWGNTFQRRIPIHRIDRINVSREFTPLHCAAFTTRFSDHRMVIADFLLNPP